MSVRVVEPATSRTGVENSSPAPQPDAVRGGVRAAAVLAPSVAAAAALLIHTLLPNEQHAPPTHLYPLLLEALLVAALALAAVQWAIRPLREWAGNIGPLCAGAVLLLCVWDLITLKLAWMPLPFFPGPDMVLQAISDDRLLLLERAFRSLRLLLTGYLAGVGLGFVSGVLMGWFREIRYWGVPLMKVIGPIPATALIPLSMVLFPNLFLSAAALIAFAVWFPVTMLTMSGIANTPVSYFDVARTLGARRRYLIFRVAIPAAMPSIFIGVFIGLLASLLTLIAAEALGGKGLGEYIVWKKGYAEYDKVYAALVIIAAFCSGLLTLLFKVRDWVLGWQKGVIRW